MKEKDLSDKFDDCAIVDYVGINTEKCVQIAKDYAEAQKEKEAIEFYEWRSTTPIKNIDQYTNKEAYQLFKNRENER